MSRQSHFLTEPDDRVRWNRLICDLDEPAQLLDMGVAGCQR